MKIKKNLHQISLKPFITALAIIFMFSSCSEDPGSIIDQELTLEETENLESVKLNPNEEYSFDGPMFDIAALPNGAILVADFATVKEIGRNGIREITTLPLVEGPGAFERPEVTFINGLEPIGNGNFFAARSGLDLAAGAALFRATRGNTRLVGDIESFTLGNWSKGDDPGQAGQSPSWKSFNCEPPGGYTAGPQTNPYHLTALSGSEVLIADAAGNSLLYAKTNGEIEVVATFPPVMNPDTGEPMVLFPLGEDANCFVEPVPTAVAIGADGAYYVGELNGVVPANFGGQPTPDGLASVWRVEQNSRNVECPSDKCEKVVTGLNSVIDAEFGPDGYLYVVEFDKNGFFAAVVLGDLGFGTVKKCDVSVGTCEIIEDNLVLPGAITFDKWDNLWLLDNVFAPTVRQISRN